MGLTVVTPPSAVDIQTLLSPADLKLNLRITNSVEDGVINDAILAAYDWLAGPNAGWLNRSLINTTYRLTLPGFVKEQVYSSRDKGGPAMQWVPTSEIVLPLPPLVSVTSVKYLVGGLQTTLPSDAYVVATNDMFGRVVKKDGTSWPSVIDTHPEAVEIVFVAGYGNGLFVKTNLPAIRQAMKLLAGDFFRNREDTYAEPRLVAVNRKIVNGVTRLAGRYRIMNAHA